MLQPFAVADATLDWYRRYVRAGFPLHDPDLDRQREQLIDGGLLWTDSYIALARPGLLGPPLAEMGALLDPQTLALPWGFSDLYDHQRRAIERLAITRPDGPQPTLVLSGTGSGKTEAFLLPIVDACNRDPGPGVKALIVYPMNALANDQLARLRDLLADSSVTFGRYTGDAPETDAGDARRRGRPTDAPANMRWSRQAMRDDPPNVLLTNYTMLEYLLIRRKDEELFRHGPPSYLVIDEIHLFSGVLGAEVGGLVRRFRHHVGGAKASICVIGTSATAGSDQEADRLRAFAEQLFGASFDADGLISERAADPRQPGPVVVPAPQLTDEDLRAAGTTAGLAALAKATLGVDLSADAETLPRELGSIIDEYATVSVVERALEEPAPISAAAQALGELPERDGVGDGALRREAQATLLLGASAIVGGAGESEPQPRFRPRVHQIIRSMAGLSRCADPAHGELCGPDGVQCSCGALTLPVATCRTCGEAFWTSPAPREALESVTTLDGTDVERGTPAVFVTTRARLDVIVDVDEEENRVEWVAAALCPTCGAFALPGRDLRHAQSCPRPAFGGVEVLASTDNVHCPACGDRGARDRPILLPLRGSAAASVAVITQGLSDNLRENTDESGGRLLVFADSRQDAAQQAGYADDQGARIAVRQLVATALAEQGPTPLGRLASIVQPLVEEDAGAQRRWLVGELRANFAEVSGPDYLPSQEQVRQLRYQIEWEIALEVTERARRRFSLEREGMLVVTVEGAAEIAARVADRWPSCPLAPEGLAEVISAVADVLRYGRAVSQRWLKLPPRTLIRNHGIRVGDQAVRHTRGYGPRRHVSGGDGIDIRGWTSPRAATRLTEVMGRVLAQPPTQTNEFVETLVERLSEIGLFTRSQLGGRTRWMLDENRLLVARRTDEQLWRCSRCGAVRSALLRSVKGDAICVNWHCPGTPQPFEPAPERDFYRRQYEAAPRRLIVREHSAQVDADTRLSLEARFNDHEHPIVDAIACTPTLEVGVSLDDLNAVVLRNLPPAPANYVQRVGRAGRRSKVALALAHASQAPHDSYFFEHAEDLISGQVRAPTTSLDNAPLLRRHVNSLILEVLDAELPPRWVAPLEGDSEEPTVADPDGVLLESAVQPFDAALQDPETRSRVEQAIRGSFMSPSDPARPAIAESVCLDQMDRFADDLRRALNRWCDRYRALVEEWKRGQHGKGIPSSAEKALQDRIYREVQRLGTAHGPEQLPLGFLGAVGFLPRYGFTATSVLLHADGSGQPLTQAAPVAITEYAPGNIVYARGRRLRVQRLDPPPVEEAQAGIHHRDNVLVDGRRCNACAYLTTEPLDKSCPSCRDDLVSQAVLRLTGVSARGGPISSEDEYRRRSAYDVRHLLGDPPEAPEVVQIGGYSIERSHTRRITLANAGLRRNDGAAAGFDLCVGCGLARDSAGDDDQNDDDEGVAFEHSAFCPARTASGSDLEHSGVWLVAEVQGDVLEISLPAATRGVPSQGWRASLAEALLLGIQETMQAGRRDLAWFERIEADEPVSLVIYDTLPGGTGYIPKLLADGAAGLREAAREVAERLVACDCTGSCHRCLQDFWNQRHHSILNRFEVVGTLARLAGADVRLRGVEAEDEQLESFLEREFFERLKAAGLPLPTLQIYRELEGGRVTIVDCEYRDPDVSIYLDGRAYHAQSEEQIVHDLERRNALEAGGSCVLEFTYWDVMERFDEVATMIRKALAGTPLDPNLQSASLRGLHVLDREPSQGRMVAEIDQANWLHSEPQRRRALNSSNIARLAGWRLERRLTAHANADG